MNKCEVKSCELSVNARAFSIDNLLKRNQKKGQIAIEQSTDAADFFHSTTHANCGSVRHKPIQFRIQDLKADSYYLMYMDLIHIGGYQLFDSGWRRIQAGSAMRSNIYLHSFGPCSGDFWTRQRSIYFRTPALVDNCHGKETLRSVQCYQPRVHVLQLPESLVAQQLSIDFISYIKENKNDALTFIIPLKKYYSFSDSLTSE